MIYVHFSCHEEGFNGINEVDQAGNNFWVEDVVGGSNQTYLSIYAEVCKVINVFINGNHITSFP